MNKLTITAILALGVLSLPVSATTVTFSAATSGTQRQVVLNDGATPVPSTSTGNSLVLAGVFSSAGSFTYNPAITVAANFNNMLSDGFSAFGYAQPGNGAAESSSYTLAINTGFSAQQVSGQIVDTTGNSGSGLDASFFDNKQLYIVIFDGTSVAFTGSSVTGATQMGVFTSTAWTFPANAGPSGGGGAFGTYATSTGNTVTPVGGAGSVNASPNQLELAAAPEPSTLATLAGSAALMLLIKRRRLVTK